MHLDPIDVALCVSDEEPEGAHAPLPTNPPIVQTSLFSYPSFRAILDAFADEYGHTIYTRGRNTTVRAVEEKLAALERGEACLCFASGMAAVSAVMFGLLSAGDHVLFVNHVYGPSRKLGSQLKRFGVENDAVLDADPEAVRAAIRPNTRMVWMESPSTFLMRLADVRSIAAVAREAGALVCFDNSWATPLLQKPIELGADIVVHSATKYLAGHGDTVAGAAVGSEKLMRTLFQRGLQLLGGAIGPFDAWLLLRGMRTLPARLRQHEEDGLRVARYLAGQAAVRSVHHPAREGPPELVASQLRGYSGLLSFELVRDGLDDVTRVIDGLRKFRIGVSWGGVESVVISPEGRAGRERLQAHGIPPGLIRLSVGLEGADLLIEDLERALEAAIPE
jgi:cystathionine beta-lyase/cystathionine gamma-synthase